MKAFGYHPFDLRQLVSFAEVARTGSVRQASRTLHIVQPALSRQIKQLETALGIYLFDRTPSGLHLTIEGRELAERLPVFFSQIEYLMQTVKGANHGGTRQLRIGDLGAVTVDVIAPALRHLRTHWPNLRVSTIRNNSEGLFHDLLDDRIDCAFTALKPKSGELTGQKLCQLEIGVMLPPGHPLSDRSEIRLEQLRNEHWIVLPRKANPVFYDELISCCHKAGFAPDVITEMTQPPVSGVACRGVDSLAARSLAASTSLFRQPPENQAPGSGEISRLPDARALDSVRAFTPAPSSLAIGLSRIRSSKSLICSPSRLSFRDSP